MIKTCYQRFLPPGDALLVVPPVTRMTLSSHGPHVLQAVAAREGLTVRIFYGSLSYAAMVGPDWYEPLAQIPPLLGGFLGERLFARAAHGLPPLGRRAQRIFDIEAQIGAAKFRQLAGIPLGRPSEGPIAQAELLAAEQAAMQWVVETAEAIAEAGYPVVGCSTMFDQTNASLALLREVKRRRPETITIIGGANCAGSLSRGIIGLDPMSEAWDYIFDGEAEITFPRFLADLKAGRRPTQRVIGGAPCLDLDSLPPPGYDDYLEQHAAFVGGAASIFPQRDIQYETSRGCYRHLAGRCHFCGLNGEERRFRLRAPETVVKDVAGLHEKYPDSAIFLADTIVPDRNLGALADVPSGARLFGQVASRTSAQRAVQFQQAGFFAVLPGFESLDTTQLRAMGKGTRAADNVNAMRRLWSAGVTAFWNLLWGFPDEDPGAYRRMAAVIDRIHHLPPPRSAFHVYVTRDSSFRTDPARFGIRSVSPLAAYDDIFPEGTDTRDLAMVFTGDYDSPTYKAADELLFFLDAVDRWRAHWNPGPPPALALAPFGDLVLLMDTRGLPRSRPVRVFTLEDARLLMQPRQLDDNPVALAAVEDGLALALDGEYVPLAVAKPELLDALGVVDAVPVQSLV